MKKSLTWYNNYWILTPTGATYTPLSVPQNPTKLFPRATTYNHYLWAEKSSQKQQLTAVDRFYSKYK